MHLLTNTIRLTLLVLLLITPWLFGGVWARVQWVLMLLVAMLLAADLVTRFGDDDRPNLLPSAWLPLVAGILLGLFQLVPWPLNVASYLAPGSVQWNAELLDDAAEPATVRVTRTMYPAPTREYLALLTLVLAVFVLASIHLVDRQTVIWFFAAVVTCGALLSFFGLVQRLSWNGKFYWVFEPLEGSVQSFGPFVNRNNAGGFLNLCLAAGLGLLVWVHWDPASTRHRSLTDRRSGREGPPNRRHARSSGRHSDIETSSVSFPLSYESSRTRATRASFQNFRQLVFNYTADLNTQRLVTMVLVGFVAGGVLCTASRGSILALFAAAMVTSVTMALRRGNRGYAAGLLAVLVAGVALMSWAGQTEFVRSRVVLMFDQSQYERGRVPNWIDALRAVPQFPLAGSGLGTYPFVYERFQRRFLGNIIHRHAENQYLQTLVEGGLIAELLLWITIALTALAIVRLYRAGGPVNTALAMAGTFGLTSQMVGGLFDFGLYIPSNAILMAALCGIVIGRAALLSVWPADALDALDRPSSGNKYVVSSAAGQPAVAHRPLTDDRRTVLGAARSQRARVSKATPLAAARSLALGLTVPSALVTLLMGCLLIGCLFGSLEMSRAARIETATRRTNLERLAAIRTPEEMLQAAAPLITALPQRWDDAQAHQHLALLCMMQYQCETYRQLAAQQPRADAMQNDRAADIDAEVASTTQLTVSEIRQRDPVLWSRASVLQLHRTLWQLESSGDQQAAQKLRHSATVQQWLVPAVRHFLAARQYAPTIARVHYRLAELSLVVPSLGDEQSHLQHAQRLSPGDATLWYWSGLLQLDAQRLDETCRCWRKSLLLSRQHLEEIVSASQGRLTIRQLLDQTLPRQADLLLQVTRKFFATADRESFREIFLARAEQAFDVTDLRPAELAYTRAAILNLQGRKQEAASFYADAISRQSNNPDWRYEYARLLMELEQFDNAREHVAYLHNTQPKSATYQKLLDEFNAKRWRVGVPSAP